MSKSTSLTDFLLQPPNHFEVITKKGRKYVIPNSEVCRPPSYLEEDDDSAGDWVDDMCGHDGPYWMCERTKGHEGPHMAWDNYETGRLFQDYDDPEIVGLWT